MILKAPVDKERFTFQALFTNSARGAWRHILSFFRIEAPEYILLPAYIGYTDREGSGVFDPVLQTATPYAFYPLHADFSVDIGSVEKAFQSGKVRLFLLIHYFGFCPNDMELIRSLCDRYKVILVEDCAHAYTFGNEEFRLGYYGDFAFYSLHKFFAVDSGGILLVNNEKYHPGPLPPESACDPAIVEQVLRSKVDLIIEKRRANYAYLYRKIAGIAQVRPVYPPDRMIIPQSFPVLVETISRPELYFRLMERNVPTIALYYRLIDVIGQTEFSLSHRLSATILNLPVHQDTDEADIDLLVSEMHNAVQQLVS